MGAMWTGMMTGKLTVSRSIITLQNLAKVENLRKVGGWMKSNRESTDRLKLYAFLPTFLQFQRGPSGTLEYRWNNEPAEASDEDN